MFGIGYLELMVILVIVLVLFWREQAPGPGEVAREVHEGVQEGDWGGTRGGADTQTATRRCCDPGAAAGVRVLQESP